MTKPAGMTAGPRRRPFGQLGYCRQHTTKNMRLRGSAGTAERTRRPRPYEIALRPVR
jgi:hypothetical protein